MLLCATRPNLICLAFTLALLSLSFSVMAQNVPIDYFINESKTYQIASSAVNKNSDLKPNQEYNMTATVFLRQITEKSDVYVFMLLKTEQVNSYQRFHEGQMLQMFIQFEGEHTHQ